MYTGNPQTKPANQIIQHLGFRVMFKRKPETLTARAVKKATDKFIFPVDKTGRNQRTVGKICNQ